MNDNRSQNPQARYYFLSGVLIVNAICKYRGVGLPCGAVAVEPQLSEGWPKDDLSPCFSLLRDLQIQGG